MTKEANRSKTIEKQATRANESFNQAVDLTEAINKLPAFKIAFREQLAYRQRLALKQHKITILVRLQ